jgi:hypothetical protein
MLRLAVRYAYFASVLCVQDVLTGTSVLIPVPYVHMPDATCLLLPCANISQMSKYLLLQLKDKSQFCIGWVYSFYHCVNMPEMLQ